MTNPKSEAPSGWVPRIGDVVEWEQDHHSGESPVLKLGFADEPGGEETHVVVEHNAGWSSSRFPGKKCWHVEKKNLRLIRPAPPADAQVEMNTECAACGKMHVGGARESKHGTKWSGLRSVGEFRGAPLCDVCGSANANSLDEGISARGGWPRPPNPAPVEEWFGFRKGERVRHPEWKCDGAVIGFKLTGFGDGGTGYLICERDDRLPYATNLYEADLKNLTRVSEPAKNAAKCDHSWEYRVPADVCRKCGIDALTAQGLTPPKAINAERTGDHDPEAMKRAAWYLEQDAIHAAKLAEYERKKQQAAAQLDAKLTAHPRTWPSAWSTSTYESDW